MAKETAEPKADGQQPEKQDERQTERQPEQQQRTWTDFYELMDVFKRRLVALQMEFKELDPAIQAEILMHAGLRLKDQSRDVSQDRYIARAMNEAQQAQAEARESETDQPEDTKPEDEKSRRRVNNQITRVLEQDKQSKPKPGQVVDTKPNAEAGPVPDIKPPEKQDKPKQGKQDKPK